MKYVIATLLVLLYAPFGVRAADSIDHCGPAHRMSFGPQTSIGGFTYSPDGRMLYVLVQDQAINLWEVLVWRWPEELGALALALVVIAFILLRRRKRRRAQVPGEPHCRKCNYCLKGCASQVCPECGRAVAKPIIGRTPWRWTMPFAAVVLAVAMAYATLPAARVPRTGVVADWFHWWSFDLRDYAARKPVRWLIRLVRSCSRIVEVDVATGQTRRTILAAPLSGLGMRAGMTPDGTALVVNTADDRLALVSTRSGSVVARLDLEGPPGVPQSTLGTLTGWTQWNIIGFDTSGRCAYVEGRNGPTTLLTWDLRSNKSAVLIERRAEETTISGYTFPFGPTYWLIPGTSPARFLESPWSDADWMEEHLIVRDSATPERTRAEIVTEFRNEPHFSPDGRRVLIDTGSPSDGFAWFDLTSGELISRITSGDGVLFERSHDVDSECQRLVVAAAISLTSPLASVVGLSERQPRVDGFLVRDLKSERWIGFVERPGKWDYRVLRVAPDGRSFVVSGSGRAPLGAFPPPGQWYGTELLIYDLTSLPRDVSLLEGP